MENMGIETFWKNKRVLVTGHTGFKGSWFCEMLLALGARVAGVSLDNNSELSLFTALKLPVRVDHHLKDIRDLAAISALVNNFAPDFIFHFAAQSLVRAGYSFPVETWTTNVLGTVNVLEAARFSGHKPVIIVATTDKVYSNLSDGPPYSENDYLWGVDPYSASKVGVELVVECWNKSYLNDLGIKMSSVRAGNVVGGGDWSPDRIVPDLARACAKGETLIVRNSDAVRPWQHVLDPLYGYLTLARKLSADHLGHLKASFNFGPDPHHNYNVSALVQEFTKYWPGKYVFKKDSEGKPEANKLLINSNFAKEKLGWLPKWDFYDTVRETALWYKHVNNGEDALNVTQRQISEFLAAL